MERNLERLNQIYDRTDGYCHICHRKLSFKNYGEQGLKGSWHIEHSVPKAKGGTDHLNNLYPACISCNVDKGTKNTKTVRSQHGYARAPYSKSKKKQIKSNNTAGGALLGGGIGLVVGGPFGGLIGGVVGGLIGNSNSPKK